MKRLDQSSRNRARQPVVCRSGPLQLEVLEERWLMDGAAAHLVDDQFEMRMNEPARVLDVLANDAFDDGYAGRRVITSVSYGSQGGRVDLAADRGAVVYTPPPDFSGSESFIYLVDDTHAARVTISVVSPLQADDYEIDRKSVV